MAKKKKQSRQRNNGLRLAFVQSIKGQSKVQLKRWAQRYGISQSQLQSREDYVALLSTTTSVQQHLDALRNGLMAGRTSVTLLRFTDESTRPVFNDGTFRRATKVPQVVHVGSSDTIFDGKRHIMWAVLVGENHYIDPELELQSDGKAAVIHSFYDVENATLQVRTGAYIAKKIGEKWAEMNGVEYGIDLFKIGISTRDQLHRFADQVEGRIVGCHGEHRDINGFGRSRGVIHPELEDLRGTGDYESHVAATDPIDEDIAFNFGVLPAKVGVGFNTQSLVFRRAASEDVIWFLYGELLGFWENKRVD